MIRKNEMNLSNADVMESYMTLRDVAREFKIVTYYADKKWIYRVYELSKRLFDCVAANDSDFVADTQSEIQRELRDNHGCKQKLTLHYFAQHEEVTEEIHAKNMQEFMIKFYTP
jgi:hypothetical protein